MNGWKERDGRMGEERWTMRNDRLRLSDHTERGQEAHMRERESYCTLLAGIQQKDSIHAQTHPGLE